MKSSAFVSSVGDLPEDVVALYGAFDGFDLYSVAAPHVPVFALFAAASLEVNDAERGFPKRVAVFQGGDEVQICVYRRRKTEWWCSYEYGYEPVGKAPLDVAALLDFAIQRSVTTDPDALDAEFSWETYFKT